MDKNLTDQFLMFLVNILKISCLDFFCYLSDRYLIEIHLVFGLEVEVWLFLGIKFLGKRFHTGFL